jgi:hypothetical protein
LRETRYPTEMESRFESHDQRLSDVTPIMLRVLQMCSHETYMDCPFYEQLQYIGDTRLQVLTSYTLMQDDRLARKALLIFDESRLPEGLTYSRYPSRVLQITRPFSIWWAAMVHDYAMWRDDFDFRARANAWRARRSRWLRAFSQQRRFSGTAAWPQHELHGLGSRLGRWRSAEPWHRR